MGRGSGVLLKAVGDNGGVLAGWVACLVVSVCGGWGVAGEGDFFYRG